MGTMEGKNPMLKIRPGLEAAVSVAKNAIL
jgi:hypothetical protein